MTAGDEPTPPIPPLPPPPPRDENASPSESINPLKENKSTEEPSSEESSIDFAERLYADDRLLEATRILRKHMESTGEDESSLTPKQRDFMAKAAECETMIDELKGDREANWIDLGKTKATSLISSIYYKLETKQERFLLLGRADTPIPTDLLVPLISVLNESDLYHTWLPSWSTPKLGIRNSTKLQQTGRCSQVLSVVMDMPWPLPATEAMIGGVGLDDIDANGVIAINLKSLHTGDENGLVPAPEDKIKRVDFSGGFLFRQCPKENEDYLAMLAEQKNKEEGEQGEKDYLLVSLTFISDAKIKYLPQFLINFVARTVIGAFWNRFLVVALEVRDGKRPQHTDAIEKKRATLYDWVEERVCHMLHVIKSKGEN